MERHYLVLANQDAGSAEADALARATAVLGRHGRVEVVTTSTPEELDDVLPRATGTVVVAGGDGTLHAVVNALARGAIRAPVGLIPLGTGNDFARGAGIPLEPDAAARLIIEREASPIDLLVAADGSVVINNVHLGVGAQASHAARPVKGVLGRLGYAAGALVAGVRPRFLRVCLTVDGEVVVHPAEDVAQIAVAKGPMVGGGTPLAPDADTGDGVLHVMVSRAVGPVARLRYVVALKRGRHVERPDVEQLTGRSVDVSGEPFLLSADGELSGPHSRASWHLARAALQMHVGDGPDPDA